MATATKRVMARMRVRAKAARAMAMARKMGRAARAMAMATARIMVGVINELLVIL
jgi:hypothetical protein